MPEFKHKIGIVVPTLNRYPDLHRMLTSLAAQTSRPHQVIIVDGGEGNNTVERIVEEFPTLNIRYLSENPPSLARQRNLGMGALEPGITLGGYIDDDIVLESDAVEAMLAFWESAGPEVGGVRFNITNERRASLLGLRSLFRIESSTLGRVTPSGFNSSIGAIDRAQTVQWLSGGATIWSREVINEFQYDEWYQGTGYLEDLDYSYQVGQKYQLVALAEARVQHYSYPLRKERNYLLGKWQAINRMYFVRKHDTLSVPWYYWSMIGEFLLNVLVSLASRDWWRLKRAWGNLVGLAYVAQGKVDRIGGIFK
ncbi:MAG: glycosyltransferase family 2 protein [Dehalococcoidia bacterium]